MATASDDDHHFFAAFKRNRSSRLNVAAVGGAGLRRAWQFTNDQVIEWATNAQTRGLVELDDGVITLTPRGRRAALKR